MSPLRRSHAAVAFLFALALHSLSAHALTTRSFVSANGNDANNCTRPFPCRTLQVAHDKTIAGGEINMLDVAGYGAVTITKSMSVVNDGVGSAGVLVPAGVDGVTINAGANGVVNLRGLVIEGAGVGSSGVAVISAKSVTIQNCVIRNLVNHGIAVVPSAPTQMAVSDTYIAHNGATGVVVQPSGVQTAVKAIFTRVQVLFNGTYGVAIMGNQTDGKVNAAVVDSVSANNGNHGFYLFENSCPALTTDSSVLTLLRSTSAFNAVSGVVADGPCATVVLGETTTIQNGVPLPIELLNGATGASYGDNRFGEFSQGLDQWARQ